MGQSGDARGEHRFARELRPAASGYTRYMSDELIVIRTFLTSLDAEVARGALEAAGIDAMIRADDCGGTRPRLWMHGVELLVRSIDSQRADEVLSTPAIQPKKVDKPKPKVLLKSAGSSRRSAAAFSAEH